MSSAAEERVRNYVQASCTNVYRSPVGEFLKYPYLVPAGPYEQLWDWDAVFMGIGLLDFGSAPYLAGSMKNFLCHVDERGQVPGCIAPKGFSPTLYHCKPVIIQGAWIAAHYLKDFQQFWEFRAAMSRLCAYWMNERRDSETGLYVWYDQMESGADDLTISPPRDASPPKLTVSSTDLMVFLYREYKSYAKFLRKWSGLLADGSIEATAGSSSDELGADLDSEADKFDAEAVRVLESTNKWLWNAEAGHYVAFNVRTRAVIPNRVFLLAFPLMEDIPSADQAQSCTVQLQKPDMWTAYGVRSTSSTDPRYNNDNRWLPDSNWQGPIWINSNCILVYSLLRHGFVAEATQLATNVVNNLARDLDDTNCWHECYNSETGDGLACPNFLSWNVLAGSVLQNVRNGKNPMLLDA